MLVFPIHTDWITWSDLFLVEIMNLPLYKWSLCTAPGAPPVACPLLAWSFHRRVSRATFRQSRAIPGGMMTFWRPLQTLALRRFGLGFDRFFISQLLLYYLKRKGEIWKLQWRWMKYCTSSRLDVIILFYIRNLLPNIKDCFDKGQSTPPKARSQALNFLDARPLAARRKLLWRPCCCNLSGQEESWRDSIVSRLGVRYQRGDFQVPCVFLGGNVSSILFLARSVYIFKTMHLGSWYFFLAEWLTSLCISPRN